METINDLYREFVDACGSESPTRTRDEVQQRFHACGFGCYRTDGPRFLMIAFSGGNPGEWPWGGDWPGGERLPDEPYHRTATVDQVMSWRPCYDRARVEFLWGAHKRLTVEQIAALDIPLADRLWALPRMMSHRQVVAYACDCAARVMARWPARYPRDRRPQIAIATTRRWIERKATLDEVRAAAYAAAAVAAYAGRETEQRWQLRRAVAYLGPLDDWPGIEAGHVYERGGDGIVVEVET